MRKCGARFYDIPCTLDYLHAGEHVGVLPVGLDSVDLGLDGRTFYWKPSEYDGLLNGSEPRGLPWLVRAAALWFGVRCVLRRGAALYRSVGVVHLLWIVSMVVVMVGSLTHSAVIEFVGVAGAVLGVVVGGFASWWYRRLRRKYPPLQQESEPSLRVPVKVRRVFDDAESRGLGGGFFHGPGR